MNKRLNIGFIAGTGEDENNIHMIKGALEASKVYDVNIICYSFHYYYGDGEKYYAELKNLFDVIDRQHVDGLMVLGWMHIIDMYFEEFVKRFSSIPVISLGKVHKNVPSLYMSGEVYVQKMLLHLIEDHGYKRIAFISPFLKDDRNIVYEKTLKQYNIYNPNLVINPECLDKLHCSDFDLRSKKVLSILMDDRKEVFDAIMCNFDHDAVKLLDELKLRGLRCPDDIAITSYEDSDEAKFGTPKITTIYYPYWELGYYGCEKMVELIQKGSLPLQNPIPSKLILRDSCGCFSSTKNFDVPIKTTLNEKRLEDYKECVAQVINVEISALYPHLKMNIEILLDAFLKDHLNKTNFHFAQCMFKEISEIELTHDFDYFIDLENILIIFQKNCLPYIRNSNEEHFLLESILMKAHLLIKEKTITWSTFKEARIKDLTKQLIYLNQEMTTALEMSKIIDILAANLYKINISTCCLFLVNEEDNWVEECPLALEYINGKRLCMESKLVDPSHYIFENFLEKGKNVFVQFLYKKDDFLGFFIFEPDSIHFEIYYPLSVQLSTVIYDSKLHEKLRRTQNQLVQSEKMVALGRLVAGVAHEINTPLGVCVTAISHLQTKQKEMESLFRSNHVKKDDLNRLLNTVDELSQMVSVNMLRAVDLVTSFKRVAIDSSSEEKRVFKMKNFLDDVFLSLIPKLKGSQHKIAITCDDSFEVRSFESALFQIITNIVMNALIHAFNDGDIGTISINVSSEKNTIILVFADNGKGIDAACLNKIYDPFFTTNRVAGCTGLGLHVVYNIVTQKLMGNICCESTVGIGTQFTISFPT